MASSTSDREARVSSRDREGGRHGDRPELPSDLASWYDAHRAVVYRYVRFRVATREQAEDVTAEVFFKALGARRRYRPDRGSVRTWLLAITRNAVTDHLRRLRRTRSLHVSLDRVSDLALDQTSPEERLLREERSQRLLNSVRTLRGRDQEVLSLRYGAGLSNAEVGEALGTSAGTAAVRIHRALARLRDRLAGEEDT